MIYISRQVPVEIHSHAGPDFLIQAGYYSIRPRPAAAKAIESIPDRHRAADSVLGGGAWPAEQLHKYPKKLHKSGKKLRKYPRKVTKVPKKVT